MNRNQINRQIPVGPHATGKQYSQSLLCENCGGKMPMQQADRYPGQMLRNQALFESERMTLRNVYIAGTDNSLTGNVINTFPSVFATYTITTDIIKPKKLYDLPHLALNAYLIIKDFTIIYRGAAAAAHSFAVQAYYYDLSGIPHLLAAGNLATAIGFFSAIIACNPAIVMPAGLMNVSEPLNVGTIGLTGMAILGADTGAFDVSMNIGVTYATPEDM